MHEHPNLSLNVVVVSLLWNVLSRLNGTVITLLFSFHFQIPMVLLSPTIKRKSLESTARLIYTPATTSSMHQAKGRAND